MAVALLLGAAGPQRRMDLALPNTEATLPVPVPRTRAPVASALQPAPLPNRNIDGPVAPRAGTATSVKPSLFTRNDTYRGEGFTQGSSATADQDRRVRPGAGINLRMPFTPN